MSPRRPLLLVLPVLALGVAACGGGDSSSSTPAEPNTVLMKDSSFKPQDITVRVGTTLTWRNADGVPHDVVNVEDGRQPHSELFTKGKTYRWTPNAPGTIHYVCTIHPGMKGTITVTK